MVMKRFFPIAISSAAFFLSYFSRLSWGVLSVYSTLTPTVADDSVIFSTFFVGYILVQLPSGLLSDRYSSKVIVFIALGGLAVSSYVIGAANQMFVEYIASFFLGFSAGWIYPATIKILSNYFKKGDLSVAIGYYSIAWPLALVLSGLLLPPIAKLMNWRVAYYMIAVLAIVVGAMVMTLKSSRGEKRSLDLSVIKDRNVLLVSLGGFMFFFSYWSIAFYSYRYLVGLGISDYIAGVIFAFMALTGIPSTLFSGHFSNKFGLKRTLSSSIIIYGILVIIFALLSNQLLIAIDALVMGFVRFLITPGNSSIISAIGEKKAGSASGTANLFWQASGVVSPAVSFVFISTLGYEWLWLFLGIIIIASSILYMSVKM